MSDYIKLGSICGFFGLKGWVKIFSYSRPRIGIAKYQDFYFGNSKEVVRFTKIKKSGKNIVGHLQGVNLKEDAKPYIGKSLFIKKQCLPKLENEYYWHELIGLTVTNKQNIVLGKITQMMETGANDVMIVACEGKQLLIPYVLSHFVLSVNIDKNEMQVDWDIN